MSELIVSKVTLKQLSANGSIGTAGQVLVTDGVNAYWGAGSATPTPGGASGQIQFNNAGVLDGNTNLTFNPVNGTTTAGNLAVPGVFTANTISANGSVGTAGQVLTSNGTSAYWSTLSFVSANSQIVFTNTISFVNTVAFSNTITITGVNANGSVGTAGQVLKTNGATTYWANDSVSTPAGNHQQIQFNNNGVFGADNELYYDVANNLLSAVNIDSTGTIYTKVISANGSVGSLGQVLTSDGTKTFWSTPSAVTGSVNTAAQYLWTNTQSFSNTISFGAISANGVTGSAGQVLTSNGTSTYWSTITGVDTNAQYNFANTITFSNTVAVNKFSANGSTGLAGQALFTNGTSAYWANVVSNPAGATTQVQFNDGGAFGSAATFTFDKATGTLATPNYTSTGTFTANAISANGSAGANGQVLTSNGTSTFWFTPSYFDANAAITFANTITFSNTVAFNNTASFANTVTLKSISANGSVGTAGQVLTSNGTSTYWSNVVTADAQVTFSNTISFANVVTFSNTINVGGLSANGTVGTAGQILYTDGAKTYWGTDNVGVYSIVTGTGLAGGPITTTGTISLANTTVIPGAYGSANTVATFTVDQQGRLTLANNRSISIDWLQISSGKPTTVAGYGITDAVKKVNGVLPDVNGNVAVSLTSTSTGTLTAIPSTANDAHVYVVSNDPIPANDGRAFIYNAVDNAWYEISGVGQATNDARYVNVTGDTMFGDLGVTGLVANGSIGNPGETLYSDGIKTYWAPVPQFDANAAITFANTITFDGAIVANGSSGTSGQMLFSNGSNTYWGDLSLNALSDVDTAGAANGSVLYFDSATSTWKTIAGDFVDNFVSAVDFATANGELKVTRNDGNTFSVDLDGRYLELANGGIVSGSTTYTGGLKSDVAPVSANDVTTKAYVDTLVANAEVTINTFTIDLTGNLVITESNANVHSVNILAGMNLDSRFVNSSGDTISGDLIVTGNTTVQGTLVASNTTLTLDNLADVVTTGAANGDILYFDSASSTWKTIAGDFTDNFLSSLAFDTTNGAITATRNDGNTITVDLDGRYLELTNGGTVAGSTLFTGGLKSDTAPVSANDVTTKAYVDALVANAEVTVASAAWSSATGNLAITDTAGNTVYVNLDGRYPKTVNGIVPDASGNIALGLGNVTTGLSGAYPAGAVEGDIYIVSGEADPTLNGKSFIFDGSTWQEISGPDMAAYDARYVNSAGDTMTGALVLSGNPTSALEAAPKQYVDALVANSEVTINAVSIDATGNLVIEETNGNLHFVDILAGMNLDARFVNSAGDTMTGNLVIQANVEVQGTLIANNTTLTLDKLADVDTTGAANGSVIYFDGTTSTWKTIAGNFSDSFINGITFDTTNGAITATRNDGNTVVVDIDGRYLELANGGTVAGSTTFTGGLKSDVAPVSANDVTTKAYVDGLVANSEISINAFSIDVSGNLVIEETNGNLHFVDLLAGMNLDSRFVNSAGDTMTGNLVIQANVEVQGTLIANTTTLTLDNLADVDTTGVANGSVIYFDSASSTWKTIAGDFNDNFVTALAFDGSNGTITATRNDGNTFNVNIDGRYAKSVNGIVPDAAGNVAISLTAVTTGTLGTRPASANEGDIYVVSGDTAENNGKAYIYDVGSTSWLEISGPDMASYDARYVNVAGDTMTGPLTLAANPTNPLEAATKQYVDSSEVTIASAAWSTSTGNLSITDTAGNTVSINLDGRYPRTVNGLAPDALGNIAVSLTKVTTGDLLSRPSTADEGDVYVVAGDSDPNNNGKTWIYDEDSLAWIEIVGYDQAANDARYVNVAGDTMFGVLTLVADPTNPLEAATKNYVDTLVANAEVTINAFSFDGSLLSIEETNGNIHSVSIVGGLDTRYVNIDGDFMTGDLTINANTTVLGTLVASNTTLTINNLADVDTTGVANGDILYFDSATTSWKTIAGDFTDNFVTTAAFDSTNGVVTFTRNDGNTVTVDLDGRYLELTNGGTVSGLTLFTGGLQSNTVPALADDVTNKSYVDALVANAEISINAFSIDASGNLVIQETNGNTHAVDLFAGLDARYVNVTGDVMTGNLTVTGLLANGTIGTAGQVLYTDGAIAYWANNDGVGNRNTYDSVAPATFIQGDIWYDTSTGKQNIYWGGVWNDMLDGGTY